MLEFYNEIKQKMLDDPEDVRNKIILAEIFVNYYTCAETLFFRISQFFENGLDKEKWHYELLRKMTLEIPDVREQVITEELFAIIDEFRRFRHFKRYYYQFNYDEDKLDFLKKKFEQLIKLFPENLKNFKRFLEKLQ